MNDLEVYLDVKQNHGVILDLENDDFVLYLKIIVLLYADDMVIISDDAQSFQKSLNDFYEYCKLWKLAINIDKSKVIIFGSRANKHYSFKLGPHVIDVVDSYKYLGVIFSKNGSFLKARKYIAEQSRKALHYLYTRINNLNLPIDLQIKLFDHTIIPIMTFGCEVWGFEDTTILERIHVEFLRFITKTKKSTPHYVLCAELGRYPIETTIKSRMIGFWSRLIFGKESKFSSILYYTLRNLPFLQSKWINYVKQIFLDCGRQDIWNDPLNFQNKYIGQIIKRTLIDQNYQIWHAKLQHSSKGSNYELFKENIMLEPYFLTLERKNYLTFVKFRTANHRFPVETLRWENIPLQERKCQLCNDNDTADEFHYLLRCKFFDAYRQKYIHKYYYKHPNVIKFKELMCSTSAPALKNMCLFIDILMKHFNQRQN